MKNGEFNMTERKAIRKVAELLREAARQQVETQGFESVHAYDLKDLASRLEWAI